MTIKLDNPGGDETPHMCFGYTKPEHQVRSNILGVEGMNRETGRMVASIVTNTTETVTGDDIDGTENAGDMAYDSI